ncbi:heparin lyase I family protein [Ichthyenterobacterium sp. W332]|uniref:Heparin lyase I family protein n=1 Tax=Microcosmobacter mediterraneus TaxID=3075607 RepID=A0ABU2YFV2_9FLAO|nr:heparin lyase I family protein [Ichthyenterobacterium sp. W332]MDT0557041.1 heparin lyase I family protein [Ichthyenterobacterium sp. W332]
MSSCNQNDEVTSNQISTDISVSTSVNSISWVTPLDLNQSIESALNYSYGLASESETEKQQVFNIDSSEVNATIAFKTEFQDVYRDLNPLNNSVTINLNKEEAPPQGIELKADGPGNTYELINSVLAPGHNPIEAPDCSHEAFGEHIDEFFDSELNDNVFRFHIHVLPDNDRCINFDRQRNEIKSYNQSPDNLLGIQNETVVYTWKFKLPSGFQSSPNFTHIHQLKSVGGDLESMPMYTLTTRKGTPDKLQLRYAETDSQITLEETELEPFIDTWLEVTETITYSSSGSYAIEIKKISDNSVLFSYTNSSIINWRPNAEFVRPKWGIYRSLINEQDLRDESVLYNDFSITEIE